MWTAIDDYDDTMMFMVGDVCDRDNPDMRMHVSTRAVAPDALAVCSTDRRKHPVDKLGCSMTPSGPWLSSMRCCADTCGPYCRAQVS